MSASRIRAPESVLRAAVLDPAAARLLERQMGLPRRGVGGLGYRYDRRRHLWIRGRPAHLAHRLEVARCLVAWLTGGHPAASFIVEPRLPYRSPAGGERSLDPDALFQASGRPWALEVDRGTEGERHLRHKIWRYREFLAERARIRVLFVVPAEREAVIRRLAREAVLPLEVTGDFATWLGKPTG